MLIQRAPEQLPVIYGQHVPCNAHPHQQATMATNTRSQRPTNHSGISCDPPVSSSKPPSKHKRTTSSAAENPKTKQQKYDEDEVKGTGKEQGRKGKKEEKKAPKGKKNRKTSAMRAEEDAKAGSPLKLTRAEQELEASSISVAPPKRVCPAAAPPIPAMCTLPSVRDRDTNDDNSDIDNKSDNNDINNNSDIDMDNNSHNTNSSSSNGDNGNMDDEDNSDHDNDGHDSNGDSTKNDEDEDRDQHNSPKKTSGHHDDEDHIRDRICDRETACDQDDKFNNLSGELDSMDSNPGTLTRQKDCLKTFLMKIGLYLQEI
ncbi:uncharacterized protein LACBIDRAFT_335529 [Laccaria bicolor S238N-H82]|uniref:Predicted protein n=1 Tax=Laccaria bicolor (strain S238N-H82 / ATCC MYA-4686) TaxID=486041 RepID=B0E2K0_LACBS|nr:uncharacterized protein LACBIDRAFT_335529 [Laccaria bicolor S238N-H82]EDQ98939.1 predicted protein [Laccaria bicolor S238N-H82]|eukprot:XP_001890420.1 predicted protein [Laccaria bicolor S238N-H82]